MNMIVATELESDQQDPIDRGRRWLVISILEKLRLISVTTLVLLMWKWIGLFLRNNHLLKCWDWFSLLNWIGALTLFPLPKLHPRKLEPLIVLWSFLLSKLSFISLSLPHNLAWKLFHIWAVTPSCYLNMLDKLQKRLCRTVGTTLTASLEPLDNHQSVACLILFYSYYSDKYSSELDELVLLTHSCGRSTRYSNRLHGFSVAAPRCYGHACIC